MREIRQVVIFFRRVALNRVAAHFGFGAEVGGSSPSGRAIPSLSFRSGSTVVHVLDADRLGTQRKQYLIKRPHSAPHHRARLRCPHPTRSNSQLTLKPDCSSRSLIKNHVVGLLLNGQGKREHRAASQLADDGD